LSFPNCNKSLIFGELFLRYTAKSKHNNRDFKMSSPSNGHDARVVTHSKDVPNRGYMTFGTSALLALNDERVGKRNGNGERFTDVIPKLAEEGFKVVIAQRVVEAVRGALAERGQAGYDAPVLELLDKAEQGALYNVEIIPSDTRHDSYEATKALIAKYAGGEKPVYAITNSTQPSAGRPGLMREVARDHPKVVLVTTTALLHDLHATALAQRLGVDSEHLAQIAAIGKAHRPGTQAADAMPIDSTGHAIDALDSIHAGRLRHGVGELGVVFREIVTTTKPHDRHHRFASDVPRNENHTAIAGAPAESYVTDAADRDTIGAGPKL
jgi:hypothetical protein